VLTYFACSRRSTRKTLSFSTTLKFLQILSKLLVILPAQKLAISLRCTESIIQSLKGTHRCGVFLSFLLFYVNVFHSIYSSLKSVYPSPNERCPLVDTPDFARLGAAHPFFGKPVNGCDLFHGTKQDAVPLIMQNGFDDHFFNPGGYFGAGAYFADDPGLSMSFVDASPSHMFVCNVILGITNDTHHTTPLQSPLGRDFRPALGVDSMKGRVNFGSFVRQSEYIVYRFGQCKATYLLRFDH
jgi:hypothetical protein